MCQFRIGDKVELIESNHWAEVIAVNDQEKTIEVVFKKTKPTKEYMTCDKCWYFGIHLYCN